MRKLLSIVVATAAAFKVYWTSGPDTPSAKRLAVLSLVGILWITEAIHITATALLMPLLAVALGRLEVGESSSSCANPIRRSMTIPANMRCSAYTGICRAQEYAEYTAT